MSLYFTNRVNNTNFVDDCANFSFAPLHGLVSLSDNPIRIFEVRNGKVIELSNFSLSNNSLVKVIQIVLSVLLVIPLTVLGLILKAVAQIGSDLRKNNCLIDRYIRFEDSLSLVPANPDMIHLNRPNVAIKMDLFVKHALPALTLVDIIRLQGLNKAFWKLANTPHEAAREYRRNLKGIAMEPTRYSFSSLWINCTAHAERFHYTQELVALFGGIQSILQLKLFQLEDPRLSGYQLIESVRWSDKYKGLPSLCRLRLKWYDEGMVECILIKYTLCRTQQNQVIWTDYLLLRYQSYNAPNGWRVSDCGHPDYLPRGLRDRNQTHSYVMTFQDQLGQFNLEFRNLLSGLAMPVAQVLGRLGSEAQDIKEGYNVPNGTGRVTVLIGDHSN